MLALERIAQIPNEKKCAEKYQNYFENGRICSAYERLGIL